MSKFLKAFRSMIDLPLLAKDLIQQSNRPRMFIFRVLFAVFIYALFALVYRQQLIGSHSTWEVMGRGRDMLLLLTCWVLIGTYLFLPPLAAGGITDEKQRNTLSLLMLTKLSTESIIYEKICAAIVPMLSNLLTLFPLFAYTYALGGTTLEEFLFLLAFMLTYLVWMACLAVTESVYCSTTTEALVRTYCWAGVLSPFLIGFTVGLMEFNQMGGLGWGWSLYFKSIPLFLIMLVMIVGWNTWSIKKFTDLAFIPNYSATSEFFHQVDAWFKRLNKRWGGWALKVKENSLPKDRPIYWRQTAHHVLGNWRYLLRIWVAVQAFLAVAYFYFLVLGNSTYSASLIMLGGVYMLMRASSLFVDDKLKQTFDLILVTPISTKSLIQQYQTSTRRLMLLLFLLMVTINLLEFSVILFDQLYWQHVTNYFEGWGGNWQYVANALILLVNFSLQTFTSIATFWGLLWLGTTIGLRFPNRLHCRLALVCCLSVFGLINYWLASLGLPWGFDYLTWTLDQSSWSMTYAVVLTVIVVGTELLRRLCYWKADDWLGRCRMAKSNALPKLSSVQEYSHAKIDPAV